MKINILVILFVASISASMCENLILGDVNKNKYIIHHEVAQYNAIPLMKRVKNLFYSSPDQKIINSLLVYDNLHSKVTATITAGGIGYTYVNLMLKSERGDGLDYDIGIYS